MAKNLKIGAILASFSLGGGESVSLREISRNLSKFVEICRNLSKNVKKFKNFDWKRFCQRNLAKNWQKIRKLAPFWHDFLWEGGGEKAFLSEKFVEICQKSQKIRKLAPFWHDFHWEAN